MDIKKECQELVLETLRTVEFRLSGALLKKLRRMKKLPSKQFIDGISVASDVMSKELSSIKEGYLSDDKGDLE